MVQGSGLKNHVWGFDSLPRHQFEMIYSSQLKTINKIQKQQFQDKFISNQLITDGLGKKIDPGIIEAVTFLNLLEIPTTQSCEGHLPPIIGDSYPWIEISTPEINKWDDIGQIEKILKPRNLKSQKAMLILLDEFYINRNPPAHVRLTFRFIGIYGDFRIQSLGGMAMEINPLKENRILHRIIEMKWLHLPNF